ncbi:MAG: tyrosine recombinase XerD [Candidatus Planktophila sp.]|nr:tyrosine recombinase XerD [Candidatus Planktophila sp.]
MAIQCSVAVATYLDHLRIERGLSINSIASYARDLAKFQLLIEDEGLDFAALKESDLSTLIGKLSIAGLAPTSINRFLSSLKGFYKYAALEYQIANPMGDIAQFKIARKLPKALSVEEISRLIESTINPLDPTLLRDRAILEVLYGTGARVAELVALDVHDISKDSFDGEEITIIKLKGKGSKERLVPIGKYALAALEDYLVRLRPALLAKNSQNERALFLNARGTRLTRQSAWTTVLKAAESVGLQGRVSPHVFRHSYATHLLDGGADIRVVQELLGHASVTTTQIYTLVTIDKVRESYTLAHPRS